MCRKKIVKRYPSFRMRVFGKKIKLPSFIQTPLDKLLEKESMPRRIHIIGTSSSLSLAATWLASRIGKPLFRVDLAMITSKYIGETEKNLNKIFSKAKNKDWILFFDEADALFGKRTSVNDAHDRFANIDTNWLLQNMEKHEGLIILATHSKGRISDDVIERLKIEEILETSDEEDEDTPDE